MAVTRAEYEAALSQVLIENNQLTEAGETVCDYGADQAMNHPELSDDQTITVIKQHFPQDLDSDVVQEAITTYYSEMI
jgi:hypothetical protein